MMNFLIQNPDMNIKIKHQLAEDDYLAEILDTNPVPAKRMTKLQLKNVKKKLCKQKKI